MTVTTSNLIQGPAVLYHAVFGATEPATVSAAPAVAWTDVGGTKDGVELTIADEYGVLDVDQEVHEMGRRRTKRVISVKTQLAEATLDNLARATANSAPLTNVMEGDVGLAAFAPAYSAILLDGIAPGGFRRRIILRRTLPTDSVGVAYKKDGMTLIPVTWTAHFVTSAIKPYKIEDATA